MPEKTKQTKGINIKMKNLLKIVIIDDEMILRNGLKYLCDWEEYGFTIVGEASNGMEGLHMIQRLHPDIVITDIVMPEMDGISLTAQIKKQFPDIHIIVLSSYDNFSYAKSSFKLGVADYLLKPELETDDLLDLLRTLGHLSNPTPEKNSAAEFFQEILTFYNLDDAQCISEFRSRGVQFQESIPYTLLVTSYQGSLPVHRLLPLLTEISLTFFPEYTCISCVTSQGYLCVLLQPAAEAVSPSASRLSAYACHLEQRLETRFTFACAAPSCTLCRLSQIYQEMCGLLSYSFYFPEKKILFPEDVHKCDLTFPDAVFAKYLDPLRIADAGKLVIDHLENAAAQAGMDVFTLKKQVENAVYMLIQALTDASFYTDEINAEKIMLFKRMDLSPDFNSLRLILDETFARLEAIVQKGTLEREGSLFYRIEEYIRQNCEQDLKLYDLARQFHLNYTYLSTLFYQNTEEHFSDYLNRTRVEKAKELLRTNNNSIQYIGEKCGFVNQGYFSKIFKKFTGCSPREYQKLYRKGSPLS